MTNVLGLSSQLDFLFTDSTPELDGLESNGFLGMFHTHDGKLRYVSLE